MLNRCECRYNCLHHEKLWYRLRKKREAGISPTEIEGLCFDYAGTQPTYLRVECTIPGCRYTNIYVLCFECSRQVEKWIELETTYMCESCLTPRPIVGSWSVYQDRSTHV